MEPSAASQEDAFWVRADIFSDLDEPDKRIATVYLSSYGEPLLYIRITDSGVAFFAQKKDDVESFDTKYEKAGKSLATTILGPDYDVEAETGIGYVQFPLTNKSRVETLRKLVSGTNQ